MASETNEIREKSLNFLEEIIEESIAKGETRVQTRFPPEPNGYLHIGHAKSICINFGLAKKYGGKCNLRFDDTNPVKEDVEYVDSIKRDIQWLGFQWELERYASDYFDQLYEWAVVLIKKGLAYVDDQTQEQIRENRGTVSVPGTPSPWRDRSVEENLDLFERMKNGEFPDYDRYNREMEAHLALDLVNIEKISDAWAYDYAEKKVAFLKEHPDLPHYFVGAGNQWGATYSYAMCYWEEMHWIRTKSIHSAEFFHGMQEILVADTPVTLFMGEDEQRPLAERVARFLPKVCGNYTIIDTKELPMEGISPEFRGSLSHLMMHAVNNRVDAYMELFLRHPLSIRRYYRQFDY